MDLSEPTAPKPENEGPEIELTGVEHTDVAADFSTLGDTVVASPQRDTATSGGGLGINVAEVPALVGDVASAPTPGNDVALVPQTDLDSSESEATLSRGAEARWAPSNLFLAVSALVVAVLDLASKEWAKQMLAGPDLKRSLKRFVAIPDHLDFIFAQNPGGAWSFLRSMPDGLRRPFFLFVSSAAIVFIVSVYRRLEKRQWAMRWGLPLALGGAIGNLADRVRYGWVVDFIDFYWKSGENEAHWPTFNVADVAIVVGVGLMGVDLFSLRRAERAAASEHKASASPAA